MNKLASDVPKLAFFNRSIRMSQTTRPVCQTILELAFKHAAICHCESTMSVEHAVSKPTLINSSICIPACAHSVRKHKLHSVLVLNHIKRAFSHVPLWIGKCTLSARNELRPIKGPLIHRPIFKSALARSPHFAVANIALNHTAITQCFLFSSSLFPLQSPTFAATSALGFICFHFHYAFD